MFLQRQPQWRAALFVSGVNVGTVRQQQLGHGPMPLGGGDM
jgi:hypothetical protein